MKLSMHQRRVIAALYALDQAHKWHWWIRDAIGDVVGAGGFHQVIQLKTMTLLKQKGLVHTQRSSWPLYMRTQINCSCAACLWGLTPMGVMAAKGLRVVWSEETQKKIERLRHDGPPRELRDEDDRPWRYDEGSDDDDDDHGPRDPSPAPKAPGELAPC